MLHYQSWKGCQIQKRDITMEAFSELKAPVFEISPEKVFSQIGKLGKVGKDTLSPSSQTAWHYQRTGQLLWVNRQGVTPMADTLLQRLIHVDEIGFASTGFKVQEIESDLQRFKALDFDGTHTVNDVVARLEYNLTKAYLTYVAGQRYGFVNPKTAINRVESKPDSAGNVKVTFVNQFDIPVLRPNKDFYAKAFHKIAADSVGEMMSEVEPIVSCCASWPTPRRKPAGSASLSIWNVAVGKRKILCQKRVNVWW